MHLPRLSDLSLEEKVGQLFVHAARGTFQSDSSPEFLELVRRVEKNGIGGIIWMQSNVHATAWLIAKLQACARIPLLMSADLEAGAGMRFSEITWWPPAMAVAATGNVDNARLLGLVTAREARAVGIHQIFAPVVDVNVNPRNPVINTRSFGEDPEAVSRYATAFIEAIESEGLIATAKHFPGHGDCSVDSHRALPVLDVSRERLDAVELVPFRAAIAAGVSSVMVGHLSVPQLDAEHVPVRSHTESSTDNPYGTTAAEVPRDATVPATLSRRIVAGLLREELGFRGLVVTDAMDMGGVVEHFAAGEAAIRAIEAGCDQIVMSADLDAALVAVTAAVKTGRLGEELIDEAVTRILEAKRRAIVGDFTFDADAIAHIVDAGGHQRAATELAEAAVTRVGGNVTVPQGGRAGLLIVGDVVEAEPALATFEREFRKHSRPVVERLHHLSGIEDVARAVASVAACDIVVAAFLVRARSGLGRISIPANAREAIARLATTKTVIGVACGSPYLPDELPQLAGWLCVYGPQPVMQRAAVRALFGEIECRGILPVRL